MINTILIGRRLYAIVALIVFLLFIKLIFSFINTQIIDEQVKKQQQALATKMAIDEVIKNLQALDVGLRGYALTYKDNFAVPFTSAASMNDSLLTNLENHLKRQNFPKEDMEDFYLMKQTLKGYYEICDVMMQALQNDNRPKFDSLMVQDLGYEVFYVCMDFIDKTNDFENKIIAQSKEEYEAEIIRNYIVLIILILLIVPTLFYTAFHTNRAYKIAINLKEAEKTKKIFLEKQNEILEKTVDERTKELALQNNEIATQNEEIRASNELLASQRDDLEIQTAKLQSANEIIEKQNLIIRKSNQKLLEEVETQTNYLKKANIELVKRMSQLEEFAFIVSHKLRAPVARILGLIFLFNDSKNQEEANEFAVMISKATYEMDDTIKEMNLILETKNQLEFKVENIDISKIVFNWVNKNHLLIEEKEIEFDLENLKTLKIRSIGVFFENILINLLHNAVKFSHPGKESNVKISSGIDENYFWVSVEDNGVGIDLEKYGKKLFSINSRFHEGYEGKGMGLYVSKILSEHINGRIIVRSAQGEGSTFTIVIPYKPAE
ncbi:sensor histidine kinase [Chondrinema litorale]|uniref:sensor histidine kinase n=1 Tax=Chondrinema litorale TaxID=2994555 RepID=UPI002543400D|nr:ATP-binding protein [Chondrinema litorale]UZR98334.1 ATP-binding protein [Chondrinema litorale]